MAADLLQFALRLGVLLLLAWPLGRYMAAVFSFEKTWLDPILRPVETLIYKITGISCGQENGWKRYAADLMVFNLLGILAVFLIQVSQGWLPFNPESLQGVSPWDLALNTAVSFTTNTNWQSYAPETTVSYATQMWVLTVQNFKSAATGLCVAIALIRSLSRKRMDTIGNFYVDLVRGTLWVLLPLSILFALLLVHQGSIQNLSSYLTIQTLEGVSQTIAMGPVASQEAIKLLGTNGGGFFNANSAHPFENPTPLTNFLSMIAMQLIPAALTFTFGRVIQSPRQGYALLAAFYAMFIMVFAGAYASEIAGNPILSQLGVNSPTAMEGKEVRFGVGSSVEWAMVTTGTSTGAVNSMHDSYSPLGGMFTLINLKLGCIIFGGVGAGFYGIMLFVVLTVFIVGLMVGRTPEYLGKKIDAWETKMAVIGVLVPPVLILTGSAIAAVLTQGVSSISNPGPHGLSQIMYAFASASNNNGSAFAGLNANTPFYNLMLAAAMFTGRFCVILPVLAIAGNMVTKKISPPGPGTFPTTGAIFVALLISVVVIVGALTFLPVLTLTSIVEHLFMLQGTTF